MKMRFFGVVVLMAVFSGAVAAERSEDDLIAVLKSGASRQEKDLACRELVLVGTAKSVPTLAALLGDAELSHMARYVLEPIPGPEVDAALRDALGKLKGRRLVGVIGSIGVRRDVGATEALARLLGSGDTEVAEATARALGRMGSDTAARELERALGTATGSRRAAVVEGLFRCAEALSESGDDGRALARYEFLLGLEGAPHQVRAAALRGVVLTRGEDGLPLLLEALRSKDFRVVGAAVRTALELPGSKATVALAGELGKLAPDTQVLLALVLAKRGDRGALPGLIALAEGGEKAARIAAIRALAELGDGKATAVLVKLQTDPDEEVTSVAEGALAALEGPEVDAALMAMLKGQSVDAQTAAIRLLGRRRAAGAVSALIEAARGGDETVRVASLGVLGEFAGKTEFPVLLDILSKAENGRLLKAAEGALSATCGRMAQPDPKRVKILKALYGDLPNGTVKDVTKAVAAMVAEGKLAVEASNGSFGDPTPGVPKRMRVDYTVAGRAFSETVGERGVVNFRASSVPDAAMSALCAALEKAAGDSKCALLRVLGAAGGEKALNAVRAEMAKGDENVKRAAESVFCGWPGVEALPALLDMARTAKSTRSKVLALRGCCRLIPLDDSTAERKLALVKEVLGLSERDDEKRLALSALAEVGAAEALGVAMSYVGTAGLKEEACLAAVSVGEKLGGKSRAAVADAMAVVLKTTANKGTKKRARVALDKARGSE